MFSLWESALPKRDRPLDNMQVIFDIVKISLQSASWVHCEQEARLSVSDSRDTETTTSLS